jgi:hypothetical protein
VANYVIPLDVSRQIADKLIAAAGLFDGASIGIYNVNVAPGPNTVLADLPSPAFTGSAPVVIGAWNDAFIGADGNVHLTAPSEQFTASATPGAPETIYGAKIIGDPGGTPFLIAAWKFDTPVEITVKYDGLNVDIDVIIV